MASPERIRERTDQRTRQNLARNPTVWPGACPSGSVCSSQETSNIGGTAETITYGRGGRNTRTIYNGGRDFAHRERYVADQSGGPGTRYHYAHVDGKMQIIGRTEDGGQTWEFDDYTYANSTTPLAGADYQKDLTNPESSVSRDTRAQLNREIERANIAENGGKPETAEQKAARKKAIYGEGNDTDADKDEDADNDKQDGKDDNEKEGKPDEFEPPDEELIKGSQKRTEYGNLTYPRDLNAKMQDFLNIMMVEYKPRGYGGTGVIGSRPNMGAGGTSGGSIGQRKILCTITLPIPAGISDSNSTQWGVDELTPVEDFMTSVAKATLDGDGAKVKEIATGVKDAVKSDEVGEGVKNSMLEMVVGKGALQRAKGAVVNTNMELLFQGPVLRDFTFTFPMYPRDKDEAKVVQQIIRTLKQGSSAKKSAEFRFITAPNTFFLSYYHKGSTHPFLNTFKECALTGITMQYTPDGNYSTYHDGSMTAYQMQLSFKEIEPVFDSDYEDLKNVNMIGY